MYTGARADFDELASSYNTMYQLSLSKIFRIFTFSSQDTNRCVSARRTLHTTFGKNGKGLDQLSAIMSYINYSTANGVSEFDNLP